MFGLYIALFLLPFMQIGYSYWVAGHIFAAASMLFLTGNRNLVRLVSVNVLTRAGVVLGLLVATAAFPYVDGGDILRTLREAICFFLISGTIGLRLDKRGRHLSNAIGLAFAFAIFELALTIVQTFYLSRGVYFGIPQGAFVINTATLPGELDLKYSDIRPMGTYGEPSYLSGASFALIFGLRKAFFSNKLAAITIICLSMVIFLSRSMSGTVAVLVIWLMILKNNRYRYHFFAYFSLSAAVLIVFLIFSSSNPFTRLNLIANGDDHSFYVRVVAPILAVPSLVIQYPFGIPFLKFLSMGNILEGSFSARELIQNGFFNILINYGIFGIFALMQIFSTSRNKENAFLIMVLMFQNGGFLTFDKFAIISIAMIFANSLTHAQSRSSGGGKMGTGGFRRFKQRRSNASHNKTSASQPSAP